MMTYIEIKAKKQRSKAYAEKLMGLMAAPKMDLCYEAKVGESVVGRGSLEVLTRQLGTSIMAATLYPVEDSYAYV